MKADAKKVVSLHYTLKENDENGATIQVTPDDKPLAFIFGVGQLLPEFEKNIAGLSVGDAFAFGLKAVDSYGEKDPNAIVDVDKNIFVVDGELKEDILVVGRSVGMRDDQGHPMNAVIMEIGESTVKLDFNHPMAGKNLHFSGKIIEVREATPEELDHGHVHGPGGHHH